MKKIGIITFHRALNYGAVLQTYALRTSLEKYFNGDVEVVDYRCDSIEAGRNLKKRLMRKNFIKGFLSTALMLYKRKNFDRFLKSNIAISKKKFDRKSIGESQDEYCGFVTGSDQVWNHKITNDDTTFLLDFVEDDRKRNSYAASMGLTEVGEENCEKYFDELNRFEKISVREKDLQQYLQKNIFGKIIRTDLDPTLLLTGEQWKKLSSNRAVKEKYILVYNVPKPDHLFEIASRVKEKTGIKVKYIANGVRPSGVLISDILYPSVEEFVNLFLNAEYVITNSFHGTVFSILFEKNMLVELKCGSGANGRIQTLLDICGLTERISMNGEYEKLFNSINWDEVNCKLEKARTNSLNQIKSITDRYQ